MQIPEVHLTVEKCLGMNKPLVQFRNRRLKYFDSSMRYYMFTQCLKPKVSMNAKHFLLKILEKEEEELLFLLSNPYVFIWVVVKLYCRYPGQRVPSTLLANNISRT